MQYNTKLIDNYMKQRKITKEEFRKICGITNSALDKIYEGRNGLSIGVIYKIYENVGLWILKY